MAECGQCAQLIMQFNLLWRHDLGVHGDSTVLCDLSIEFWGVILNLMHKKASLSDVKKAFDTMFLQSAAALPRLHQQ